MPRNSGLLALVVACAMVFAWSAEAQVSVNEVVRLKQAGLSDAAIKKELVRRKAKFKLTNNDLRRLRGAGLGKALIDFMRGTFTGQPREKGKLPAGPETAPAKWTSAPGSGPVAAGGGPLTFRALYDRVAKRESPATTVAAVLAAPEPLRLSDDQRRSLARIAHPAVMFAVRGTRLSSADLSSLGKRRVGASLLRRLCTALGADRPDAAASLVLVQSGIPTDLIKDLRSGKFAQAKPPTRAAARGPIRIAVVAPLTGPRGISVVRAIEQLHAGLVAKGGIGGQSVAVSFHDSKGDAATARIETVKALADDKLTAVIGGMSRACSRMIRDVCKDKVAFVSLAAIDPLPVGERTAFALGFSPRAEGEFVARYLGARGLTRVAVIGERGGRGAEMRRGFVAATRQHKIRLALEERVTRGGALPARSIISRIKDKRPRAVLLACGPAEARPLLAAAKDLGLSTTMIASSELADPAFLAKLGAAADGLRFVGTYAPGAPDASAAMKAFVAEYRKTYDRAPDADAVLAADALTLLVAAAREAGNGRVALRTRLGKSVLAGLTGSYRFAKSGDRRPMLALVHRGGALSADARQPGAAPAGSGSGSGTRVTAVSPTTVARAKEPFRLRFNERVTLARKHATRSTTRSVASALKWLAAYQEANGKWDAGNWDRGASGEADAGLGRMGWVSPGVSALALMAFLGEGNTHDDGPYKDTVHRALGYLMKIQAANGLVGGKRGHYLYNHAMCTLALVEAYGMTGDARIGSSAAAAVNYLMRAQNPGEAWRYGERDGDNDTSVTGWCVVALRAAKLAEIPGVAAGEIDASLRAAEATVDAATDTAYYVTGYKKRPPRGWQGATSSRFNAPELGVNTANTHAPNHTPTAIATLIRAISPAYKPKDARIIGGCAMMMQLPPTWGKYTKQLPPLKPKGPPRPAPKGIATDLYYWYQGTLAMYHGGSSKDWSKWKKDVYGALSANQVKKSGPLGGSWPADGAWGFAGGRVYTTAIAVLTMQTPYRYRKRFEK